LTDWTRGDSVAERLREYFDDHGVAYRIIAHEAAASADEYHDILGTRFEQMPKAIFLRYEEEGGKRYAILALQAHKRADLERVRADLTAATSASVAGMSFGR
jgi:Ala-tRNA(Pro) deacylase